MSETQTKYLQAEPDADGRLIAKGVLTKGLKIGADAQRDFVLREATTADLLAAEAMAPATKPLTFGAALLCVQLVSIGSFKGPFTLALLGKLSRADFARLREAQVELEDAGND